MKSFRNLVCGLIGSVLVVTTIVVRHECDLEPAIRARGRLTKQTFETRARVASLTSSTHKQHQIRLEPKNNHRGMSKTGYDVWHNTANRTSSAGSILPGQQVDPGRGSSSASEWSGGDIDGLDLARWRIGVNGTTEVPFAEGAMEVLPGGESRTRASYYGVPALGQNYVVIYNAVPKTASRAFFGAIRAAVRSPESEKHIKLTSIKRRYRTSRVGFFNYIHHVEPPHVLRGHVPFADLPSRFLYINMIRDPMERFISEYYFMRNGDSRIPAASPQRSHGYNPNDLPEGWNDTLDECVRKGSPLCLPDSGMLRLFCGFSKKCQTQSRWTLEQAKTNLERYTMVGLTDDFDGSLKILARLLPNMTGAVAATFKNQTGEQSRYKTIDRREPLEWTKGTLRDRMSYEYDFYHLVRERFYKLKESLGIS